MSSHLKLGKVFFLFMTIAFAGGAYSQTGGDAKTLQVPTKPPPIHRPVEKNAASRTRCGPGQKIDIYYTTAADGTTVMTSHTECN